MTVFTFIFASSSDPIFSTRCDTGPEGGVFSCSSASSLMAVESVACRVSMAFINAQGGFLDGTWCMTCAKAVV